MRQALGEYRLALALRPRYALAWKHLAAVYGALPGSEKESREAGRRYAALSTASGPEPDSREGR